MDTQTFLRATKKLGLNASLEQIEKFQAFSALLLEHNKKVNLTAITDPKGVALKHFADSASILSVCQISLGARMIDVGTGAGFPGIPLKIMRPDLRLTLLDSSRKRTDFLLDAIEKLELSNVEICLSRAEEAAKLPEFREKFNFAVSRAVAPLNVLCELCVPFVEVGGEFFAYKSTTVKEEARAAGPIIGQLGGKIEEIKEVDFYGEMNRSIVVVKKIRSTPRVFPRKFSKIKLVAQNKKTSVVKKSAEDEAVSSQIIQN
jgi:16S rRNA (guanine527-N7)-methyltransferase